MKESIKTHTFLDLNERLLSQYKDSVKLAFPEVIFHSKIVQQCWTKIESYFPEYQLFYIDSKNDLIGFINSIPIFWDQPLNKLPDEGWDWMVEKGIQDYKNNVTPNCLGGLQIIVCKEHQGKGFSKLLVAEGKKVKEKMGFKNFIIPIRPTFKSEFPEMEMNSYINYKSDDKIHDPWIRTHLSSGAEIIKVCPKAMHIFGDIKMWEKLKGQEIKNSGIHLIKGALNPVSIDLENDFGEYYEDNIWINYR